MAEMQQQPVKLPAPTPITAEQAGTRLAAFLRQHPKLMVLTGAGVSTDSGIPDYRDLNGEWKRKQPVQHQEFMTSVEVRKRYWGRSLVGWPLIASARPNQAHHYIAWLEQLDHLSLLVTQNVDRLHQLAGSQKVLDLHGRADEVRCMSCKYRSDRAEVHARHWQMNPAYHSVQAAIAPDGDADLELDFSDFQLLDCPRCGGILKPDVVFFGDNVARERVTRAMDALLASDGLLVVGSSLMVYSGFRFCRQAQQWGKPIASLSLGRTRADNLLDVQLNAPISETLQVTLRQLSG